MVRCLCKKSVKPVKLGNGDFEVDDVFSAVVSITVIMLLPFPALLVDGMMDHH